MAKYLIHACKPRLWYVNGYLIPSMREQGISETDINVWVDEHNEGNLHACIKSFESLSDKPGGTWHIQDDVLLSANFKLITEAEDRGIKCGFASRYDKGRPGDVWVSDMWYSFPCIRIPNPVAADFVKWFNKNRKYYANYVETGKHDDTLFQIYMTERFPMMKIMNIAPNLVEHVDWMIGGSQVNSQRTEEVRSVYWEEPELVRKLRKLL